MLRYTSYLYSIQTASLEFFAEKILYSTNAMHNAEFYFVPLCLDDSPFLMH